MTIDLKQFDRFLQEIGNRIVLERVDVSSLTLAGSSITTETYVGGYQKEFDVEGEVVVPSNWDNFILEVHSDAEGSDSAVNPQYKLFVEDVLVGTYDINHRWVHFVRTGDILKFRLNIFTGNTHKKFPIKVSALRISENAYGYYYDLMVFKDTLHVLSRDDLRFYHIYETLLDSMRLIDVDSSVSDFERQIKAARQVLSGLYDKHETYKPVVYSVGHTHIDIAWLWTVKQAIEKAERSFTTILNYMDRFEDFKFIQSQPQLYEFVREKNPPLFKRIEAAIKKGQWEPEGAMWVESDTTLVSGESLVRQILYGKRYFSDHFDKESRILWLPDVFGYSAALPQLLVQAEVPYFMSTKLSWNEFNQIPYDTFYWRGIDGSKVLTHFIPTPGTDYQPRPWFTTYNGILNVETVMGGWKRYQQKYLNDTVLNAFGYGDGGGGPTDEMLELGTRLNQGVPGMPKVSFDTALSFFEKLEKDIDGKPVPHWDGELYFEFHRGTYTTRAANKKWNRYLEFGLQNMEKLAVLLDKKHGERLETLWKILLLNQFHDILPGTSIKEVYEVTDIEYAWIENELEAFEKDLLGVGNHYYLFNPTGLSHMSYYRSKDLAHLPDSNVWQVDRYGEAVVVLDMDGTYLTEHKPMELLKGNLDFGAVLKCYDFTDYRIEFNDAFEIVSFYDKRAEREVVCADGRFNYLRLYEDLPSEYDAWDVDVYHKYKHWDINQVESVSIISDGAVETVLEIKRVFSKSYLIERIHMYKLELRLDVEYEVHWYENGKLLKTEFDVDVLAKTAEFDIQFGTISRPTHRNTSWEVAQFEVNAQKWVDMSESDYGFALINDSKYGYATGHRYMSLSLLRSSNEPFEHADHGVHTCSISLRPHQNDWKEAEIMQASYVFNNPVQYLKEVSNLDFKNIVDFESEHVILDTIKFSEDENMVVLRLYEYQNRQGICELKFNQQVSNVYQSDILEASEKLVDSDTEVVTVKVKPYEVITLKVKI